MGVWEEGQLGDGPRFFQEEVLVVGIVPLNISRTLTDES